MANKLWSLCVCLCLAAGTLQAQDDDRQVIEAARKTLRTYEKSLISLSAVLKIEAKGFAGSEQERKTQCSATIIDPSGLAVTSLTNVNPQSVLPRIRLPRGGGSQTLEFDCQVQDAKYRLSDGTEVPARVVLKDEDLDLAFLAPQTPLDEETQAKIVAIPLSDAATQVEVLDVTILVDRLNEDLDYTPTLTLGRIAAVLSKPRTCYLNTLGTLGMPVFNREGKIVGILSRCIKPEGAEASMAEVVTRLAGMQGATNRLILPAADVARLVPPAKNEMKKSADAEKK